MLEEIFSNYDGPPPDVNLFNEKNHGNAILKLNNEGLLESVHDISSGGMLIAAAEMTINSGIGLQINKPKKYTNNFEYLFGEDQGRYLIEVESDNVKKVKTFLNDNEVFNETIGYTQNKKFSVFQDFNLDVDKLRYLNNTWYYKNL